MKRCRGGWVRIALLVLMLGLMTGRTVTVRAEETAPESETVTETEAVCAHENTKLVGFSRATTKASGYTGDTQCRDCGEILKSGKKISRIKSVTLSKTSYVYNGNKKTPKVTVKDSAGGKISSKNYTVRYRNNTKVGSASVVVKFSGNYKGTVEKTFKICPRSTKLKSLTGVSKGFTASWQTVPSQVTGYQIQAASNSKFTKNKVTVNINGKSTSSGTVTSVKASKKYYVRIRTYRTVNEKNYYSAWSSAKTVTTKPRVTVIAGDSIAKGMVEYNAVSDIKVGGSTKVVAAIGLNTMTFRTSRKFGGMTGLQKVISYKPYRVYFMLGINEVEWMSVSKIVGYYETLIKTVQQQSPATDIVLLSVSPVSARVSTRGWFRNIGKLNSELKNLAEKCGIHYYDYTAPFKDSSGHLLSKYSGGDGIHWPRSAYRVFGDQITAYDKTLEKG